MPGHAKVSMNCRRIALLLAAVVLAGCAAQAAYRDGRDLLAQGRIEDGLEKYQEAMVHSPRNITYRKAYLQERERHVISFLEQADRLLHAGKPDDAEQFYQRTLRLHPGNERALDGIRAVAMSRRHARLLQQAQAAWDSRDRDNARARLHAILIEDPRHAQARALQSVLEEAEAKPSPEATLSGIYRKPVTLEFRDAPIKQVFEVLSRSSGLNFLLDRDVQAEQRTTIFLKNSTIEAALHFILLTNQLEKQVLDTNTILIYPNTPAKAKEYEQLRVRTFYLANADVKAVANTLRTILKSRDIVVDDRLNMLILRDNPDAIRLAEKLVRLHDVAEPEVMLEVEILEVKRSRLLDLGVQWPNSISLTPLSSTPGSTLTLRDLRSTDSGTVGVGIQPFVVNAKKMDADANILANPRIRARNREKAKILIGERVPNITTTSTATGFVSETVNYVDVGLKLDVEPIIYLDNEVAIKITLEVSNIVSRVQTKSGSIAYQIGTRTASTVLRLKDGENQVLAGLISDEDRSSASKVPLLGEVPLLGRLFGSTADDRQKTEIVLSITPRLVRTIQRPDAELAEFVAGTESSLRSRPDIAGRRPVTMAAAESLAPSATPGENPAEAADTSGKAAPAAQFRWQGPGQQKLGDTFRMQLFAYTEQPVNGFSLVAGFDSRSLQVESIEEGEFLKQGGGQTDFTSRIDPAGQVLIGGSRTGEGGASGTGAVATLVFRAVAPAENIRIELLNATLAGSGGRPAQAVLPAPHLVRIQP